MEFNSVSVNNCYILRDEVFDNQFFTYINAKAIYSASIFHLGFFKGDINLLSEEVRREYEKISVKLYRLNSAYLYIPFEVDYHENILYQSYYESDHFPLSVWIEEKNLIPYNIFLRIIEDIINGLIELEKVGHSHLFLTPEEVLIPLQWNNLSHVKLYNVGLNSIVSSVLDNDEIYEYRKEFLRTDKKIFEQRLIKNISEDIYAFGKIIDKIIPFCNFNNENDKVSIQKILNELTNKPDSYESLNEVFLLFQAFFTKIELKTSIPENNTKYSYTNQASFKIPEFNEWQAEGDLEPVLKEKDSDFTKGPTQKEKESPNFVKSLVSIFSKIFRKKEKYSSVSKTLANYAESSDNYTDKKVIKTREYESNINNILESENSVKLDREAISMKTKKILEEIDNHFTIFVDNDLKNSKNPSVTHHTKPNSLSFKETFPIEQKEFLRTEGNVLNKTVEADTLRTNYNIELTEENIFDEFNKSLQDRDYFRTYDIINASVSGNLNLNKSIIRDLKKVIDDVLLKMDQHYIITEDSNIFSSLLKMESINPMEINEKNNENLLELKKQLDENSKNLKFSNNKSKKNLNIFLKMLEYLKKQYRKIFKK